MAKNTHKRYYEVHTLTEKGWVMIFSGARNRCDGYARTLRKHKRTHGLPVRGTVKVV